MDFVRVKERATRNGVVEIYPDFVVCRSKDLMVRGKSFNAIWDEEKGLWSTDEYDVQRLVDNELTKYQQELAKRHEGSIQVKHMSDFSSNSWLQFRNYVSHLSDSAHPLDAHLTFSNTEVKKTDYISRRLPYPLAPGEIGAWDELVGTLYNPEERAKIEWAIGSVVAGDSKKIQKFLVFYGPPGTGKGTVLDIIQKLFVGYTSTFEAKTLTSTSAFATEAFKSNPLIAIDPDGDLSRIEDNTRLNSIVSHEPMTINEKHKPTYTQQIVALLIVASNKAVKFTDAKSGLIRRMIDINPSEKVISHKRYQTLVSQINFELGAIAHHCLDVYRSMGRDFYSGYRPIEMMLQTDIFFNYIESYFDVFKEQNGVTLQQAFEMYKQFCDDALVDFKMPRHKFREELKNYFTDFEERAIVNDVRVRSWYSGFIADRFKVQSPKDDRVFSLVMDDTDSLFDEQFAECSAQYSKADGTPQKKWATVTKTLADLDTQKEHYVKVPTNHIVIDFDLKDADGNKSAERNLEAASQWPATYAEYSKSGQGVHLHYNYEGDPTELSRIFDDGIEVKVFTGDSSLRRRLSRCNNVPIAPISSGLPLKEKKVLNADQVKSERALRDLIERNLRKEIHPGTKPSVDFIHKILEDAYFSGLSYDLTDMRSKILAFASKSTNQSLACIKTVQDMKFQSEDVIQGDSYPKQDKPTDDRIVYFDIEVFPNLFVVCWKYAGSPTVTSLVNPTPQAIEELMRLKLVAYNCRRYDNHILYGAFMGYNNEQLYRLSKKIINGAPGALFGEAYNISFADIFDYASKKQSLKKWQIELGLKHDELGLDWDEPVPEELIPRVVEYCENDVISEEQVADHIKADFIAREILADLSGLPINSTTQQHTSKIVFGDDRKPQGKFKYTDLSQMFPGYKYEMGKSTYRDEITGEGGYVYSEPGMYSNVALLDVESMHPTSIENLDLFGDYTKNFAALKAARVAIKNGDFASAREMMGGKLAKHLKDEAAAEALSYALKIVINIVYGLTSAKFDNSFRDPRNIDNIVAKRGALFMIDLKHAVQEQGYTVAHIKTDSIKIPDADDYIIDFVMKFGEKYGYKFQHEATYEKMCLVNDAVYIAKVGWAQKAKKIGTWEAVGAQFQHPFLFKFMFSNEPITFRDKCEEKHVTTALYIDYDAVNQPMHKDDGKPHFVGKAGLFCPIKPGHGGGLLVREKDGKFYAATGTKGYEWMEADMVKELGKEDDIDMSYFEKLVDDAIDDIKKFGDYEWFIS